MQYYQFFLSVITSAALFSYGACAMDDIQDEAPKRYQSPVQSCTVPLDMPPEEVIEEVTKTGGNVIIHIGGEVFCPA
jgi:hypothetical protein